MGQVKCMNTEAPQRTRVLGIERVCDHYHYTSNDKRVNDCDRDSEHMVVMMMHGSKQIIGSRVVFCGQHFETFVPNADATMYKREGNWWVKQDG